MELELSSQQSFRFGVILVAVSVAWVVLVALLPATYRTTDAILTFLLPLLIAWELGVITVYALWQYRSRVFGRLVSASTYLMTGVALATLDFTLVGLFFMLEGGFTRWFPGQFRGAFAVIIVIGVVGYYFTYRSVRELLATAT